MAGRIGNPEWVQIGTQKWATRNLDVTTFRNGDRIPFVNTSGSNSTWAVGPPTGPFGWRNGAAWKYVNNNPNTQRAHGLAYNWYAVVDPRQLAPEGWRIPTAADWNILFNFVGGISVAAGKLKEAGTTNWTAPNVGATNDFGFSARANGQLDWTGNSGTFGTRAYFWTPDYLGLDNFNFDRATSIILFNNSAAALFSNWRGPAGYAIRLLKD